MKVKIQAIFITLGLLAYSSIYPAISAESSPIWTISRAKGPTGSAFIYQSEYKRRRKSLAKRQECLNNRKTGSIVGAAIGGFLGNRLSRGRSKGLATSAGAAAGAAIGSSSASDC